MITVITGPPCSGKSTYARQHAMPGDVVIDFDVIAQALGSPVGHGHDPRLREITAAAWAAAVERLATGYPAMNAWVVDTRPSRHRREIYRRAQARTVTLTAPREELHRRADADSRPAVWHQQIDEFLAEGDPEPVARTRW